MILWNSQLPLGSNSKTHHLLIASENATVVSPKGDLDCVVYLFNPVRTGIGEVVCAEVRSPADHSSGTHACACMVLAGGDFYGLVVDVFGDPASGEEGETDRVDGFDAGVGEASGPCGFGEWACELLDVGREQGLGDDLCGWWVERCDLVLSVTEKIDDAVFVYAGEGRGYGEECGCFSDLVFV